jgi:hypothetical protein
MRKGKFDDIPTEELFSADDMRSGKRRQKSVKSVAWGNCPGCLADKMGLVLVGRHLVWRQHTYRTWSGAAVECTSSGVSVCVAPEKTPTHAAVAVTCPHPAATA